jgi:chromosome partitioning protein
MKVLVLLAQKGGSGKSTAALNLAVAAAAPRRPVVILDADPQGSAAVWRLQRAADTPLVIPVAAGALTLRLDACRAAGAGLVIVDTAPHALDAAHEAALAADLVLVPCRPSLLDIKALGPTVRIVRGTGRPGAIFLNAVPAKGGAVLEAARLALAGYELALAPIGWGQRAAFQNSIVLGQGVVEHEPKGKAAEEVRGLWRWVQRQLGRGRAEAEAA